MKGLGSHGLESLHQAKAKEARIAAAEQKDRDRKWTNYTLDAAEYVTQFGTVFPQALTLPDRLKKRKEAGQKIVVAEIFGEADARSIGADVTVSWTLTKDTSVRTSPSNIIVEGSAFSKKKRDEFLMQIDAQNAPVSCVFFSAVGGIRGYEKSAITLKQVYDTVTELYARLPDEGEMYIRLQGLDLGLKYLVGELNKLSSKSFCELHESGFDETYIHVLKDTSSPHFLPDCIMFTQTIDQKRTP